jgi:hypothetical protein
MVVLMVVLMVIVVVVVVVMVMVDHCMPSEAFWKDFRV